MNLNTQQRDYLFSKIRQKFLAARSDLKNHLIEEEKKKIPKVPARMKTTLDKLVKDTENFERKHPGYIINWGFSRHTNGAIKSAYIESNTKHNIHRETRVPEEIESKLDELEVEARDKIILSDSQDEVFSFLKNLENQIKEAIKE